MAKKEDSDDVDFLSDDYEEDTQEYESYILENDVGNSLRELRDHKLKTLGVYINEEEKEVMLLMVANNYLTDIQSLVNLDGNGYRIYFRDLNLDRIYRTGAYLDDVGLDKVREMYIQIFHK